MYRIAITDEKNRLLGTIELEPSDIYRTEIRGSLLSKIDGIINYAALEEAELEDDDTNT